MIQKMRYYVAVVETGNFSEAGELCHISQSAISQQIQALENELQVRLLDRHGRKFEVTPAGRYFYQRARMQIDEVDSLVREVRRIASGERQTLRIGVLNGFSGRLMQSAISAFTAEHPNVSLALLTGTHEEIFQEVIAGRADMVINDQRRALSDQFVNEFLLDQQMYALVHQDRLPGSPAGIELSDLSSLMCVLCASPSGRESETIHWRDAVGMQSDILFADNLETALMHVSAGIGFLPCDRDVPAQAGNIRVPILRNGTPLVRKMYAFWPEKHDSSLQWEFSITLRNQIQ